MPRDRLQTVDDVIARVRADMRKDYSVVHRFTFCNMTARSMALSSRVGFAESHRSTSVDKSSEEASAGALGCRGTGG